MAYPFNSQDDDNEYEDQADSSGTDWDNEPKDQADDAFAQWWENDVGTGRPLDDADEETTIANAHAFLDDYYAKQRNPALWDRESDHLAHAFSDTSQALERQVADLDHYLQAYDDPFGQSMDARISSSNLVSLIKNKLAAARYAEEALVKMAQRERDQAEEFADGRYHPERYSNMQGRQRKKERTEALNVAKRGTGYSGEDIGDLADSLNQLLPDALSDDGGAARKKLFKLLQSLPRWQALEFLDQELAKGVISQEVYDWLLLYAVRKY